MTDPIEDIRERERLRTVGRRHVQRLLAEIDRLRQENASLKTAYEQEHKACADLTQKVIPNLREELDQQRKWNAHWIARYGDQR